MYTIAYRVQYTFTRVHARIPNKHPREDHARKSARVGQVSGQVGEDRRACPARGKLNVELGSRRTRRHPCDDLRAEVGEVVCVGPAYVYMRLSGSISRTRCPNFTNFLCMSPVAMAQSSFGGVVSEIRM